MAIRPLPRTARSWSAWLFDPVDHTPLILFRIVFGLLCFLEAAGSIATGWVTENFVQPRVMFPHIGFEWLPRIPGRWMYAYYAAMAVPALGVMLGAYFRASLACFTVLWTGTYLLQTVSYNNHYYLLIVLCLLLLPAPAHTEWSWDARRDPGLRRTTCPRWAMLAFQVQIAIVYFYAALAKLYPDWLAGRPIEIWFRQRTHDRVLGPLYTQEWLKWLAVYGGIFYDALVVPMLLWARTRLVAVFLSVLFHGFNSYTFRIGIFPYLAVAFCLFFFPGEQLRTLLRRLRWLPSTDSPAAVRGRPSRRERLVVSGLAVFLLVQLLLPLRHVLYPGDVQWTEEGYRMAWRMMLRTKSGTITFDVRDPASGRTWQIRPSDTLTGKQVERLAVRPDMIWQFAQFLAREFAAAGVPDVEIYAHTRVSLNGRPAQPLVDPDVDLARADFPLIWPVDWIVPLNDSRLRR